MNNAIEVTGLRKSYGGRAVLKGMDLHIATGEIFALLGVNGAGKTTALECIEGIRPYDEGDITVNGKMGIQFQSSSLPAYIRPLEAVRLFAKWNKTSPDDTVLGALGIQEMKKKPYGQLSTGQKRRLHLALALTRRPDILFLDEPTAGLDVEGKHMLHNLMRQLKAQGKTIVLASHDMTEVETLCNRIAILRDGIIVFSGTPSELTDYVGRKYVLHIRTEQGEHTLETDKIGDTLLILLEKLKREGTEILDIQVDTGTLEQHFMEIVRRCGE